MNIKYNNLDTELSLNAAPDRSQLELVWPQILPRRLDENACRKNIRAFQASQM